jgi:hypothetical protein
LINTCGGLTNTRVGDKLKLSPGGSMFKDGKVDAITFDEGSLVLTRGFLSAEE